MEERTQRPYGEGVFRRRFLLRAHGRRVVGDMEDDFHRFHVDLVHDGERVLEMRGAALRYPWNECPGAISPLRALEGMPLADDANAGARHTDPRRNCTHLFDLACLAVTHAAAGRERRVYDVAVPDLHEGRTRATLRRDGAVLLDWRIEGNRITAPDPFAEVRLRGGFLEWVESHLEPELAEAALVLRRGVFIALGRMRNLDENASAMDYMPLAAGSCHSFTPGIAERTHRMHGTTLDFTHAPEKLLADL